MIETRSDNAIENALIAMRSVAPKPAADSAPVITPAPAAATVYAPTLPVCQLDAAGYYLGQSTADLSPLEADKGVYLLPANAIDAEAPAVRAGLIAKWTGKDWTYHQDRRGTTVYRTDSGEVVTITTFADPPAGTTDGPRPSVYHTWDGGKWTQSAALRAQQLAAEKSAALSAAARAAQALIAEATAADTAPEFERLTWAAQAAEAKAWHADNTAATPMLAAIAAARGVDVNVLRQKARTKAIAYEQLAARVAGTRQAIEDRIIAAADIAELAAIEMSFSAGAAP